MLANGGASVCKVGAVLEAGVCFRAQVCRCQRAVSQVGPARQDIIPARKPTLRRVHALQTRDADKEC